MKKGHIFKGHPVDIATGTVYSTYEDISIPGKVDLIWVRLYTNALQDSSSNPLGQGWTTRYFTTLTYDEGKGEFRFFTPEGYEHIFSDPDGIVNKGEIIRDLGTFQELHKSGIYYIITRWDVETAEVERYIFKEGKKGEKWALTRIEDVSGQGLEMIYDKYGKLITIEQRLEKRALFIEYTSNNRIKSISLIQPNNQRQILVRYEYNKSDQLVTAYDTLGFADRYEYDASSNITREIIKNGNIFYFKYDDKGRCIKTFGLDRYDEKTFRYLDYIGWTEMINSQGHVTQYQWLPSGQVICEINPLGAKKQTKYDDHGRIIAKIDPNGSTIKYEYDGQGNRYKIKDPFGNERVLSFNNIHLPIMLIDWNGGVWKYEYDERNRIIANEDPLGGRWIFKYDNNGNLIQVTNPNGATFQQSFSSKGILQQSTDWENNAIHYHFDQFGRVIKRVGPLGDVNHINYDLMGNPIQIIFPDGSKISATYDELGNLTSFTDGNGNTTKYRYGNCGRITERIDSMGNIIQYLWGSEPKLLEKVINEKGEVYDFLYDQAGHVIHEKGFDDRELSFEYDKVGYCVAIINGMGKRILYERDLIGNIIKETQPDGKCATFEYDVSGNLISAKNQECEVKFERDILDRIIREYQGNYFIETEYDLMGNIVQKKTNLGHNAKYTSDGNGLMSSLSIKERSSIKFFRNAQGEETIRHLPGGIIIRQEYDSVGLLIEQQVKKKLISMLGESTHDSRPVFPTENKIIQREYHYDQTGTLTSIKDDFWGKTTFTYSSEQLLINTLREKGVDEYFKYDSTKNITEINEGKEKHEILEYSQGNRLIQKGNTRYLYDDNGRLIKKIENYDSINQKEMLYSWDETDQLQSVTKPDGVVWEYTYDALGRRITKKGPNKTIQFIWDGSVIIHIIENESLVSTWIFEHETFKPICKLENNNIYYFVTDHLGTPRELLDKTGRIVWSENYKSWGELDKIGIKEVDCPIRFQGQWFDEESGLHYNRFRYYDPTIGRYISEDPVGLMGGLNPYLYTCNPTNWVDPFGLNGNDIKPADYKSPTKVEPGTRRVEVMKISSKTGQPYRHVSHYDDQGRLIGQTHYTTHGRGDHENPHHHRRDPETGKKLKSSNGTRVWPGEHPEEQKHKDECS